MPSYFVDPKAGGGQPAPASVASTGPAAEATGESLEARAPRPYQHDEWRPAGVNFKSIPETREGRDRIRQRAFEAAKALPRNRPPDKRRLRMAAEEVLKPLGYDETHIGFTMVMINNEFWRKEFASIPFTKRLFSLPHCLKQAENCRAKLDDVQLHCNGCGLCSLADFDEIGKRLGYKVLIAEGSPVVLRLIASGEIEGVMGVACLNVLEKAFDKVLQIGIPALAIPLLRDTCHNTEVDEDWVMQALGYHETSVRRTRSFVPLLRDMVHAFDPKPLQKLAPLDRGNLPRKDKIAETERISMAWMRKGGKRFRPFLTAAAWQALTDEDEVPCRVKKVAAGMEFIHKASLIHDDIEDDDDFRYGTETLHRSHTVPVALNIGDYLLGRGYRAVSDVSDEIGAEATAKIMCKLSECHVKLAEGQGAELMWRKAADKNVQPLDCLRMYALKTAPAFEAALFAGVALAGKPFKHEHELSEFAKYLGVAYQIQNDLKDLDEGPDNKVEAFGDILQGRPTLLFALALDAATEEEKADLIRAAREGPETTIEMSRLQEIYYRHEVPMQASMLAERQRERALRAVENVPHEGMQALFTFLTAALLE